MVRAEVCIIHNITRIDRSGHCSYTRTQLLRKYLHSSIDSESSDLVGASTRCPHFLSPRNDDFGLHKCQFVNVKNASGHSICYTEMMTLMNTQTDY